MGRTGTTALRKIPYFRHDRESRTRSKAGMKTRSRSVNRISASAYSPRRHAVHRLRLVDGRPNRDRGYHSHTKGLSRKSFHRSYQDEDTYFDDMEDAMDSDAESKDSDFFWDEERTLFSDLMGEVDFKEDDSEDWTALLDSLQLAFDEDSVKLKKEIAQTFVPTVNGIKSCYSMLDEQDKAYGKGVLMLNATLKEYELTSVAMEDKLKEVHSSVQNKIEMLLKQLGESYSERDGLWTAIQEGIKKNVEPVAELLKGTPANIERMITGLDKVRTRAVEKDEGNSTMYTEQMLKGLLKSLA
ncbi:hypothetical protein F5887DRAFT_939680, partial [Amanita rubescens]